MQSPSTSSGDIDLDRSVHNVQASAHSLTRSPKQPLALLLRQSPMNSAFSPFHASYDQTADSSLFISNPEEYDKSGSVLQEPRPPPKLSNPDPDFISKHDNLDILSVSKLACPTGNEVPIIDHVPDIKELENSYSDFSTTSDHVEENGRYRNNATENGHDNESDFDQVCKDPESDEPNEELGNEIGEPEGEIGEIRNGEAEEDIENVKTENGKITKIERELDSSEPQIFSGKKPNLYTAVAAKEAPRTSHNPETRATAALYNYAALPPKTSGSENFGPSAAGPASMPHTPDSPFFEPPKIDPNTDSAKSIDSSVADDLDFSLIHDTRSQFDLDISPDQYRPRSRPGQSPWRNFRVQNNPSRSTAPKPFLNNKNVTSVSASSDTVDELKKQLTNCKIQLKLYEKFLQDLIDNKTVDLGELSEFDLSTQKNSLDDQSMKSGEGAKNLVEMSSLVEDLYCSLEDYQAKWRDSDQKASALAQTISKCVSQLSTVLDGLGVETLANSSVPEEYLTEALEVLREKINSQPIRPSLKSSSHFSDIQNLRPETSTMSLMDEFEYKGSFNRSCDIQALEDENDLLRREIAELKRANFQNRVPDSSFSSLEKNVDKKLEEYQAIIERLQAEVNDFKSMSRSVSVSDFTDSFRERTPHVNIDRLQSEYDKIQRDYDKVETDYGKIQNEFDKVQNEYDHLAQEYLQLQKKTEDDSRALKSQLLSLHAAIEELHSKLAAAKAQQEEIKKEARASTESEKSKLSYHIQSLQKDKEALQQKVDNLSEKLSVNLGESAKSRESIKTQLGRISQHFGDVFDCDVRQFEKLMNAFNKIADDNSLKDPRVKLEQLQLQNGEQLLTKSNEYIVKMRESHRSVSEYFARAVDVIVKDHIRLLLREGEKQSHDKNYIAELAGRIKTLELENASLSKKNNFPASPRLKLRIEELTNRWKAEREARILDNRQAKERFKELELDKARRQK